MSTEIMLPHVSLGCQAKGLESISRRLATLGAIVREWAEAEKASRA